MPPKNQGKEKGQYNSIRYTPPAIVDLVVNALPDNLVKSKYIYDIGCGSTGAWGLAVAKRFGTNNCRLIGVEIRPLPKHPEYSIWHNKDFLSMNVSNLCGFTTDSTNPDTHFFVSNPPFDKAEKFLQHMAHMSVTLKSPTFSKTNCFILMFISAGFIQGKNRRKNLFRIFPPNLIIQLDGRLVDKSVPGTVGNDKTGRLALFWNMQHRAKHGDTKLVWVGSDDPDDYRVVEVDEPGYNESEGEDNAKE